MIQPNDEDTTKVWQTHPELKRKADAGDNEAAAELYRLAQAAALIRTHGASREA